jgi:hypothetical protein
MPARSNTCSACTQQEPQQQICRRNEIDSRQQPAKKQTACWHLHDRIMLLHKTPRQQLQRQYALTKVVSNAAQVILPHRAVQQHLQAAPVQVIVAAQPHLLQATAASQLLGQGQAAALV